MLHAPTCVHNTHVKSWCQLHCRQTHCICRQAKHRQSLGQVPELRSSLQQGDNAWHPHLCRLLTCIDCRAIVPGLAKGVRKADAAPSEASTSRLKDLMLPPCCNDANKRSSAQGSKQHAEIARVRWDSMAGAQPKEPWGRIGSDPVQTGFMTGSREPSALLSVGQDILVDLITIL